MQTVILTLVLLVAAVFIDGCERRGGESVARNTDTNTWVSVGTVNSDDMAKRLAVFEFFHLKGIPCYPEGNSNCQVMVRSADVEGAHQLLKTNRPPGSEFKSKWD